MTPKPITGSIHFPGTSKADFQKFAESKGMKLSSWMIEAARTFIDRDHLIPLKIDFENDRYILVPRGIKAEDLKKAAELLEIMGDSDA